ncbi:MAG: DUF3798 domain-containing protein [Suipraeoptans sp.]
MKKKIVALLCMSALVFGLIGCRSADNTATDTSDTEETTDSEESAEIDEDYKIGIITGTVSQGEEEFQTAQSMIETYGADRIVTATYPDKFNDEVETTISQVVNLASDPDVKAIVFVQAVPGAIAAIEKAKETRPDILFIAGVAAEPPREIAAAADVVMLVDEIGMGTTVVDQAESMGATTFVHYSFPRHLGYETIAARTELFKENCEAKGITYIEATAPDPTGDAGVSGAQQFILEDVPRKIAEYGTDTAFFSTNCSMQEPLIRTIAELGAIFPQQCCPSPYHAYPAALNIETAGHEGDVSYMLTQIESKVEDAGNTGRMSTWALPVSMLMIEAGVDYAIKYCEGEVTDKYDDSAIRASISKIASEYGATEQLSNYADDEGEIENFYMILCDYYTF